MESVAERRMCIPAEGISAAGRPDGLPPTVLLVTGDDDFRAVTGRVLAREGYRVVAAAHSGHALLASMTSGPIDVLATEMLMDDMSGPALAEQLRRHHPGLHAIYLANPGTAERDGVLVRPFTRDALLARLEAVLSTPAR